MCTGHLECGGCAHGKDARPSSRAQFWFDGLVLSGQTVVSGLLEQGSRLVNLVKKKACESGRVASV